MVFQLCLRFYCKLIKFTKHCVLTQRMNFELKISLYKYLITKRVQKSVINKGKA